MQKTIELLKKNENAEETGDALEHLWNKYSNETKVIQLIEQVVFHIFLNADIAFGDQKSSVYSFIEGKRRDGTADVAEQTAFLKKIDDVLAEESIKRSSSEQPYETEKEKEKEDKKT
jgi:hypothetical protein